MKNLGLSLIALAGLMFVACNEEPLTKPEGPKEYTVSLQLGGEILDIAYGDLTKGENDHDLYGIEVFSKVVGSNDSYGHYAYGLFDNMSGVTINLLDGYEYQFVASMVVDGKEKINYYSDGYSSPFFHIGTEIGSTSIGTQFVYSNSVYFGSMGLGSGYSSLLNTSNSVYHPCLDRYYGEVSGFVPGQNTSVSIDMKRTAFGLNVRTQGFTEGTLSIQVEQGSTLALSYPDTELNRIFTFNYVQSAWYTDNYKETIPVSIIWTKDNGNEVLLASQSFDFYRNKVTIITVQVAEASSASSISVNLESDPMTDGPSYNI